MKKIVSVFAAATVVSLAFSSVASAAVVPKSLIITNNTTSETVRLYVTGTGTETDPYTIDTNKSSDYPVNLTREQADQLISASESGNTGWYSIDDSGLSVTLEDADGKTYGSDSSDLSEALSEISSSAQ